MAADRGASGLGVLVVMNDAIHWGPSVRKADSQLIGAFRSHPGPLGLLRSGTPVWHGAPHRQSPARALPHASYARLRAAELERQRVAIWTLTVSALLPPEALLRELDRLVLAGSGSGSLPAAAVEALAPWARRLPVVICSRCGVGTNHDDFLYRGSLAKYESRGFVVQQGYQHLNPLQARNLLCLRLAAFGHALGHA